MAKDFRATQIETTKIILSGGIGTQGIGGLIYSGSVAANRVGGIPASMISDVGTDVFLFVSGTKSNTDFNRTDVTLFGGDVVISGTLYAERQVIEVDSVSDGDFFVTGNMFVKPDSNSLNSVEFTDRFGRSFFKSNTLQKQILFLSGGAASSVDESSGTDVAFYVSGAINSRGSNIRGVSLFGGDVVHSGSVYVLENGTNENLKLVRDTAANQNAFIVFEGTSGTNLGQIYANSAHMFLQAQTGDFIFRVGTSNVVRVDGGLDRVGVGNDVLPTHMLHVSGTQMPAFRVDSGLKSNLINAKDNTVYFLSGGSPSSFNEAEANDVGFYVSGSVNNVGGTSKGIALFGGDVVTSGSVHTKGAVHRKMLFKASNFIVGSDDHYVFIDTASGHVTASLQAAAAAGAGRELIFKDVGGYADANFIVIKPVIGDKIESVADELKIKVASGSISLISDGVANYYAFSARD